MVIALCPNLELTIQIDRIKALVSNHFEMARRQGQARSSLFPDIDEEETREV